MAKIKCSICSYQFNIWYVAHWVTHILIWFLALGQGSEVYFTLTTGCLGVALQPSAAHIRHKQIAISSPIYMSHALSTCACMQSGICMPLHIPTTNVHAWYHHIDAIQIFVQGHIHIYIYSYAYHKPPHILTKWVFCACPYVYMSHTHTHMYCQGHFIV